MDVDGPLHEGLFIDVVVCWPSTLVWNWLTQLFVLVQSMILSLVEGCFIPWLKFDCILLSTSDCILLLKCCIDLVNESIAFALLKLWVDSTITKNENKDKAKMKNLVVLRFVWNKIILFCSKALFFLNSWLFRVWITMIPFKRLVINHHIIYALP